MWRNWPAVSPEPPGTRAARIGYLLASPGERAALAGDNDPGHDSLAAPDDQSSEWIGDGENPQGNRAWLAEELGVKVETIGASLWRHLDTLERRAFTANDMCHCLCDAQRFGDCYHTGGCACLCPTSRTTECACECDHSFVYTSWQNAVRRAAQLARVNGSNPVAYFLSALEDEAGVRLMEYSLENLRKKAAKRQAS